MTLSYRIIRDPKLFLMGLLGVVSVMFAMGGSQARAGILTTFDTGLDGWSGLASEGPASQYSWGPTGGDPGGYFDFIDQSATSGTITAPAQYLGNLSSLNGTGILKWDQILFSTGGDPESYGFEAQISGPGGSATFTSSIDDTVVGQWIAITAPINQSSWTVNSGTWAGLLADVTSLNLSIEDVTNIHTPTVQDPGDHDGIDNVFLGTASVPEPTSLTLLGLGIASAAASSGRFRGRVARRLNGRRVVNLVERTEP
jgi:hypothetical protein